MARPPFKRSQVIHEDALQAPCTDENCFLGKYPSGSVCPSCNGTNKHITTLGWDVLRFVAENFDKVLTLRKAMLASESRAKKPLLKKVA